MTPPQAQTVRHPGWRIDDVLARTDLTALLDQLAEPATHTTRGRRWHCPLPDHDDQHPSVTTHTDHRDHQRWRCWSGDDTHRGDAIDLAAATQHLTRHDAVDWLAQRAGMIPDQPLPTPRNRLRTSVPTVVPLDPTVVQYAQACERILWTTTGRPVLDWLNTRGFTNELLHANHIGADPGRDMMRRQRGLPHGATIGAVLPALDPSGRVRYLQTRYLQPGDGPKYDNPAANLGSNPRLAWTQPVNPTPTGLLVVCEGIPDALTAAQTGLTSVAILGSQAPDHSVAARIATYAYEHHLDVVAVVDNDPAGRSWGLRLGGLLADHAVALTIIEPPGDGLDLNSWALTDAQWTTGLPTKTTPAIEPTISTGLGVE
jgi:DNA primase